MRFDCGPTWPEEKARLEEWHPFFLLWPRKVGSHDCRWLEWVERRGEYCLARHHSFWSWEYRARA